MKKFILVMILAVVAASSYGATGTISNGVMYLNWASSTTDTSFSTHSRSFSVVVGPVEANASKSVTITVYLSNGDTRTYTFRSAASTLTPASQFDIYRYGTRSDSINIARSDTMVQVLFVPYGSELR